MELATGILAPGKVELLDIEEEFDFVYHDEQTDPHIQKAFAKALRLKAGMIMRHSTLRIRLFSCWDDVQRPVHANP